jgi:hypothetical protein
MKKALLTATAFLLLVAVAVAGSDHYGSNGVQQFTTTTDNTQTASTKSNSSAPQTVRKPIVPSDEPGRGIWGH